MTTITGAIKIKFLGGSREVGRSAIAVKSEKTQILLDYGVLIGREPGFPMHIPPREVDAIVLTHAHLDHSGAIPLFHIRGHAPVYGAQPTFDLTRLLISDFIHLSGYYLPYEYIDLQSTLNFCVDIGYRKPVEIGDLKIKLLDAGHIPGSSQVIIESSEKRILYTSDFNTVETQLLRGADQSYGKIDALIVESTYADEDHMDRREVEKSFMGRVTEAVERGGTVLIPAFSVGRSQEILCVLVAHHFECPVAVDGMAKDANEILMRYPDSLRDPKVFKEALRAANWIRGWRDRRLATKKPGVIVSPAGMLKGGNAVFYMSKVADKSENAVFLVSYQVPGTPGRELLETKRFIVGGKTKRIRAELEHFDFTSHCGRRELFETVRRIDGDVKVFVVHGAEENCQGLAGLVKDEMGLEVFAPKTGDVFRV